MNFAQKLVKLQTYLERPLKNGPQRQLRRQETKMVAFYGDDAEVEHENEDEDRGVHWNVLKNCCYLRCGLLKIGY